MKYSKNEEIVMPKRPKNPVAAWLRIGSYSIMVLNFVLSLVYDNISSGLLAWIIILLCANKCSDWAVKIKRSPNWAYFTGFVFGLLGLLIYYIYYRKKLKNVKG